MRIAIGVMDDAKAVTQVEADGIGPRLGRLQYQRVIATLVSVLDQGVQNARGNAVAPLIFGDGHVHDATHARVFRHHRPSAY